MGGMVNVISNGNKMNGDLMASVLTMAFGHLNGDATILSTSVANPSVPGAFKMRREYENGSRKVFPIIARAKVGVVSMGLLLRRRASPII